MVLGQNANDAFNKLKEILASDQILTHYSSDLPLILACDASQVGVGCVLSHTFPDGTEKPIAYASKTLNSSQRAYAQIEREALAIIFGIEKFHQYLFGRRFTLLTDHKALSIIFSPSRAIPQTAAARLQRWAIKLSAFSYDVKYRNTKFHANCDGLSRLPVEDSQEQLTEVSVYTTNLIDTLPIDASDIRRETRRDKILSQVLRWTYYGWPAQVSPEFKPYLRRSSELTCFQDVLLWGSRVIIPARYHKRMLDELHSSHAGASKMKSVARSHFWFPGLDGKIEDTAKSCTECSVVQRMPNVSPVHPWETPAAPWSRIHIDLAGPFMQNDFLVVYDAGSKWGDVKILPDTTSHTIIEKLREIFSYFGIPEVIVSDNGAQFTSREFETFMKLNGIRHVRSAPFHPRTNGAAERFVQTFKMNMKANQSIPLKKRLCNFLLSYRNQVHQTTKSTPAQLMFGRNLRCRLNLLYPDRQHPGTDEQRLSTQQSPRKFDMGNLVWIRMYNHGPKWKPGTVRKITGPLSYVVRCEGVDHNRHIDQLKPRVVSTSFEGDPQVPSSGSSTCDFESTYVTVPFKSDNIANVNHRFPFVQNDTVSDVSIPGSEDAVNTDTQSSATTPVPTDENSPAENPRLEPVEETHGETQKRYPTRDRKVPDRLLL